MKQKIYILKYSTIIFLSDFKTISDYTIKPKTCVHRESFGRDRFASSIIGYISFWSEYRDTLSPTTYSANIRTAYVVTSVFDQFLYSYLTKMDHYKTIIVYKCDDYLYTFWGGKPKI